MIASLMMYQRAQLAASHDNLWALMREELDLAGVVSPAALSQDAEEFSVWTHPDLAISQTCGMPYRTWLHGKVNLVGTPDYGLPECEPGYYRSPIIVRRDDSRQELPAFKHSTFAFNQPFSQSGYAAPYWHAAKHGFWFDNKYQSGAHLASATAVAEGRADIAALDAVTWRLIQQHENIAQQLRVLEWTTPTPGLPLITSLKNDKEHVFKAVENAFSRLGEEDRNLLGIKGLVRIPAEAYLAVANPDLEECLAAPF